MRKNADQCCKGPHLRQRGGGTGATPQVAPPWSRISRGSPSLGKNRPPHGETHRFLSLRHPDEPCSAIVDEGNSVVWNSQNSSCESLVSRQPSFVGGQFHCPGPRKPSHPADAPTRVHSSGAEVSPSNIKLFVSGVVRDGSREPSANQGVKTKTRSRSTPNSR